MGLVANRDDKDSTSGSEGSRVSARPLISLLLEPLNSGLWGNEGLAPARLPPLAEGAAVDTTLRARQRRALKTKANDLFKGEIMLQVFSRWLQRLLDKSRSASTGHPDASIVHKEREGGWGGTGRERERERVRRYQILRTRLRVDEQP